MIVGFIPNLHVILLGDELRAGEYLPLGKQLVRQLMTSRYAGKRAVSPADGVLVEAWTSGEHRWVRITAIGCSAIFMDSGVVDHRGIGLETTDIIKNDGVLHYGDTIRAYLPEKKLLGQLTPPGIGSTPSIELKATRAFSAETKVIDGVEVRDPDSEATLAMKKMIIARIPASIFTGKLRLWVQAQYGKPLSEWDLIGDISDAPPSLSWTSTTYGAADRTFFIHSQNTGIYTDEEMRHWFIQFGSGEIHIHKMTAPKCVEQMRSLLLPSSTLSSAEKERVETYILSQSYPAPDFYIHKPLTIGTSWSMGYGWHFNWDGDRADIVDVASINIGGSSYKYRSIHYRITITRNSAYVDDASNTEVQNESRRWKAEQTIIETAEWKSNKWSNVIASPDWASGELAIFGQLWGEWFGSAAPVYCFYTRNNLQVVRYSFSGGDAVSQSMLASSPSYFGGNYGWDDGLTGFVCDLVTVGFEGGTSELRTRTSTPYATSFTAGSAAISASDNSYSFVRRTASGKTFSGEPTWYPWGDTYCYADCPVLDGRGSVTTSALGCLTGYDLGYTGFSEGFYRSSFIVPATYSTNSIDASHVEQSHTLLVIPFGDSEAAYLYGHKLVNDDGTTVGAESSSNDHFQKTQRKDIYGVINGEWLAELSSLTPFVGGGTPASYFDSTLSRIGSVMVSNAGVRDFDPVAVTSAFFSGEPTTTVAQDFWTTTSAGLDAAIKGSGISITGGYNALLPGNFMGWA